MGIEVWEGLESLYVLVARSAAFSVAPPYEPAPQATGKAPLFQCHPP